MLKPRSVVAERVCRDQTWTLGTHAVDVRRCRAVQAFQVCADQDVNYHM